jgi:hypothetical protein
MTDELIAIWFAVSVVGGFLVWQLSARVPGAQRVPLLVYLGSYFLTYFIGAVLIVVSDGAALTLYWGSIARVPYEVIGTPTYWIVLLLPFVVVPLVVHLVCARARAPSDGLTTEVGRIALVWPIAMFVVAISIPFSNPAYRAAWAQPYAYFASDVGDMYATRSTRLAALSVDEAAVLYNIAPFLTFVVLQEALARKRSAIFVLTYVMIGVTAMCQVVLAQAAPTLIFASALFWALVAGGALRFSRAALIGITLAAGTFVALYTSLKFERAAGERVFLEPFMRMPSVYPFYLAYVDARGHPGAQIVSILTAGRGEIRTIWPVLVGSYAWGRGESFAPAPAHVTAYADSGVAWAIVILVLLGLEIYLCGKLFERRRSSTIRIAAGMSVCCALHHATQAPFEAAIYQAWGVAYTLAPWFALEFLRLLSGGRTEPQLALVGDHSGD